MKIAKKSRINSINLTEFREIINYLQQKDYTFSKDTELLSLLNLEEKNYRKLEDKLKYMEDEGYLISDSLGRKNIWKLKVKEDTILTNLTQKDISNIDYLLDSIKDFFKKDTQETLKKIFQADNKLLAKFSMFEKIHSERLHRKIDKLLEAIENRYYLKIELAYDELKYYDEVKPIKILFVDDNWYLTFEYKYKNEKKFRLARIAFIKEIKFYKDLRYSNLNSYQKKDIDKYIEFLENKLQNSMTLYGITPKKAIIKATPAVSRYFQKNMKPFLSTQKFIKEEDDGSIIFSLEYTQDIEILPFIQRWLPDLIILEPQELKDEYIKKLQEAIAKNSSK